MTKKQPSFLLGIAALVVLVGVLVAFVYTIFERAVHHAIEFVWIEWLQTDEYRWVAFLAAVGLGMLYFSVKHVLSGDTDSEHEHGLGAVPEATFTNMGKVLLIGFLSLLAGAVLGPEAILVPASLISGAIVARKFLGGDKQATQFLAAAGIIALFTAFFNSFIVGVLALYIVVQQTKAKFTLKLGIMAVIAAAASWITLQLINSRDFLVLPEYSWSVNVPTLLLAALLTIGGAVLVSLLAYSLGFIERFDRRFDGRSVYAKALIASTGIGVLYLLGGHLVQFTGNSEFASLFAEAPELGALGLLWLFVCKVVAIAWSRSMQYRGGVIFPCLFAAATLVAMVGLWVPSFNLIYGLIAVLIGMIVADRKYHVLV